MKKKNSVLIIDDQRTNIALLTNILSSECIIFSAENGRDGIASAERYLPDVILLDIMMYDMDGYDVIRELKQSEVTKKIPVIFITSLASEEEEQKGLVLGAADYITKPFHNAIVKLRVQQQINLINLQRDLESAVEAAETANHAKSTFLANMSHEIRTPMNVIVGLTDALLEDDDINNNAKRLLTQIGTASVTLMGLINDVLDISKIESGKFELAPEKYEMASLLGDISNLYAYRTHDKPIDYILNISKELPRELYGDDLRVKQILNNLISNAFKYTNEGTVTLTVDCERGDADDVVLSFSVRDTGIGIREMNLDKLFDEYNQADTQANRNIEGTGLGLSITKGLVDLMGGHISVESEFGKGTVFSVTLPQGFVGDDVIGQEAADALCDFRYEDKQKANYIEDIPDLSNVNVLVVDDYIPNLDVAKWVLGKYKLNVDCVTNGQEAVDLITGGDPIYDAIFMDHMMPGMDGIEAARLIRTIGSDYSANIPIIALTANAIAGNEQMFFDNGFQEFLSKPISRKKLDSVVRKWFLSKAISPQNPLPTVTDTVSAQAVIEIPGVDAVEGLDLFDNDEEMYIDFLQSFVEYVPDELDKLRQVSEEGLKDYAIDVHTVKGAAAGIGANDLALFAKRLELLAKAGDLAGVEAENESFLIQADTQVNDIREWLENN